MIEGFGLAPRAGVGPPGYRIRELISHLSSAGASIRGLRQEFPRPGR